MRVFLAGATGLSAPVSSRSCSARDHHVAGLTRSDADTAALTRAGADIRRGDVDGLHRAAETCDGVIHAAFDHDFAHRQQNSENDRKVIEALGAAMAGSGRPLVIRSGTGLARRTTDAPAVESDAPLTAAEFPRGASEEPVDSLIAEGGRVLVMRLPQVHDIRRGGRAAQRILLARQKGRVAYVGEGRNRLAAVHVSDADRLYRLVLETGQAGARYHAVGEEGVAVRDIAEIIGAGIEAAGGVDYGGGSAGLFRLDGAARHDRSRRLQHADAPMDGAEPDRAGSAWYGLQQGLEGCGKRKTRTLPHERN